jgi:hypothetical protein
MGLLYLYITSNIHSLEFSNLHSYLNVKVLRETLVRRHLVHLRRSMEESLLHNLRAVTGQF